MWPLPLLPINLRPLRDLSKSCDFKGHRDSDESLCHIQTAPCMLDTGIQPPFKCVCLGQLMSRLPPGLLLPHWDEHHRICVLQALVRASLGCWFRSQIAGSCGLGKYNLSSASCSPECLHGHEYPMTVFCVCFFFFYPSGTQPTKLYLELIKSEFLQVELRQR